MHMNLIGHITGADGSKFTGSENQLQAFALSNPGMAPQNSANYTSNSTVLISNIYPYAEPSLTLTRPITRAMLVWVFDDPAKPVGQAQEIYFSRWNGTGWSTPAGITNDNILDGAPQSGLDRERKGSRRLGAIARSITGRTTWNETTARKIEIAASVHNPVTGTWTGVTLLTTNIALDMKPCLKTAVGIFWWFGNRTIMARLAVILPIRIGSWLHFILGPPGARQLQQ